MNADGGVFIDAGTTLTVDDSTIVSDDDNAGNDGDSTLTAGGDITLNVADVDIAGTLTATSTGGAITQTGGQVLGNLVLSAATGISLPIVDATTVTATNTGTGNISITDFAGGAGNCTPTRFVCCLP